MRNVRNVKSVVFTMPNGRVLAIEKCEAYVEREVLMVQPAIYRKFAHCFAYWRGMHYPMRAVA